MGQGEDRMQSLLCSTSLQILMVLITVLSVPFSLSLTWCYFPISLPESILSHYFLMSSPSTLFLLYFIVNNGVYVFIHSENIFIKQLLWLALQKLPIRGETMYMCKGINNNLCQSYF